MKAVMLSSVVCLVGCSLALDWDKNNQPCDDEGRCLDGYSCLGTQCVENHSMTRGNPCNADVQCEAGLICDLERFTCFEPCSTPYQSNVSECPSGTFCGPHSVKDLTTGQHLRYRGACVDSECDADADCRSPGFPPRSVCVSITSKASACIPGCELQWGGAIGETYSDSCGSTPSAPMYCQPVGTPARLVCLSTSLQGQGEGDLCDPIDAPCRERTSATPSTGLACIDSQCKRHCKPQQAGGSGTQCLAGTTCVPYIGEDVTFGICEAP